MDVVMSQAAGLGVEVIARATVLLLLAFAATLALRRAPASVRRQIWSATLAGLLLLPLVGASARLLPMLRLPVRVLAQPPVALPPEPHDTQAWFWARTGPGKVFAAPATQPPFAPEATAAPAPSLTTALTRVAPATGPLAALVLLYALGVAITSVRLVRARRQAARLLDGAVPAPPSWPRPAAIDVRASPAVQLPFTVRAFRPVILVPARDEASPCMWTPSGQRAVLAHEVAHVHARDPLFQLVAELAGAVFWFHPLVHLAVRQLRTERELAADDAALATGIVPSEYANLLFELACLPETPPARGAIVPLLTPNGLKARVLGVLDGARARVTSRAARPLVIAAATLAFAPLAFALPAFRDDVPPLHLGRGEVIARLIDDHGRPVADAEVHLRTFGLPPVAVAIRSDAAGDVRYPWVAKPLSEFALYARKGNDAARRTILNVPYGTRLPLFMPLRPAATASGTVRDSDGKPVAGATIRVWHDERSSFGPGRTFFVRSDERGNWRIPGLLYGGYGLLVTAPWGVLAYQWVDVADHDVSGAETILEREQPVMGRLMDDRGRPLAGVRIDQSSHYMIVGNGVTRPITDMRPNTPVLDFDVTADDGTFRLLPRGIRAIPVRANGPDGQVYFGSFDDGGWLKRAGRTTPVDVRLHPGIRMSGVVRTTEGEPVPRAWVGWYTRDERDERGNRIPHAMPTADDGPVQADDNGAFSLWVPERHVTLYANTSDRRQRTSFDGILMVVSSRAEDVQNLDLVIKP